MAKVAKKTLIKTDVELNRWCIEMAMKWPVHSNGGYGAAVGGQFPRAESDADIIGRANKIMAWVKTSH